MRKIMKSGVRRMRARVIMLRTTRARSDAGLSHEIDARLAHRRAPGARVRVARTIATLAIGSARLAGGATLEEAVARIVALPVDGRARLARVRRTSDGEARLVA